MEETSLTQGYRHRHSLYVSAENGDLTGDHFQADNCECDDKNHCNTKDCDNFSRKVQCDKKCKLSTCTNKWADSVDTEFYLEVYDTRNPIIGLGVRTKRVVPKGAIVAEYGGELVSEKTLEYRRANDYATHKHFYGLLAQREEKGVIATAVDATLEGNLTRFINHCEHNPVLSVEVFGVKRFPRVFFRSNYALPRGTEVTFNYNSKDFKPKICLCGTCSPNGIVKPFKAPPPTVVKLPKKVKRAISPAERVTRNKRIRLSPKLDDSTDIKPSTSVGFHSDMSSEVQSEESSTVDDPPRLDIYTEVEVGELDSTSPPTLTPQSSPKLPTSVRSPPLFPDPRDSNKYECENCSKCYSSKSKLNEHQRRKHVENPSIFDCEICEIEFGHYSSLKRHLLRDHSDGAAEIIKELDKKMKGCKPLKCKLCYKTYSTYHSRSIHMKSHL